MKRIRTLFLITAAAMLMTVFSVTAFAAEYKEDKIKQGLSGILPEDTLVLPKDTTTANLTASWGVDVIFIDYDESEIHSVFLPVPAVGSVSTDVPPDPSREGWKFKGWVRKDDGDASHIEGDKVIEITGPGPIIFQAVYEKLPTPTTAPAPTQPETVKPIGGGGGGTVTPYPKGTTAAVTSTQAADPAGSEDGEDIDPFRMGLLNATGDRAPIGLLVAALVVLLSAFAAVDHKDGKKTQ